MTRSRLKALLISLSLLFFLLLGSATPPISVHAGSEADSPRTVSIGINGGDRWEARDKEQKKQIEGFHEGIKKQDPAAECKTVTTKAGLVENLTELVAGEKKLKCGDQLVLFFAGHGGPESFYFAKEDESITLQEVLDLLKGLECCVKIHIVFSACYSGSWAGLNKDVHVCAVYTCCNATEYNYNVVGNWDRNSWGPVKVTGHVVRVISTPDGRCEITLLTADGKERVFSVGKEAKLTVDGKEVDCKTLKEMVCKKNASIDGHVFESITAESAGWVKGFIEDLNNVPEGTKLDDALKEAEKSAEAEAKKFSDKAGPGYETHPQEWRKEQVPEIPIEIPPIAPTPIAPIKLYPATDAEVRQFMPTTNLGSESVMYVAPWGIEPDSRQHRTFVKFSLAPLPAGATVQSATLNLYHSNFYGAGTGTYAVYRVSSDWAEPITWDNQPQFAPSPTDDISFGVCDTGKWRSWDITADIDATAIGNGWVSWAIRYVPEDEPVFRTVGFASKEGGDVFAPYLEITYLP